MTMLACSLGVRAPELSAPARDFFAEAQPWSFVLFREACVSREQVKRLCADLRDAVGREALVYIDQEGGRVARLKPPQWPAWPPCAAYGALYAEDSGKGIEAARLGHRLIADELRATGVDGDFAPVLDLAVEGADQVVGDRAFSSDPDVVAALGRAALEGLAEGAVTGCVKHAPGHGRAACDSHLQLPRVRASAGELAADAAPFKALKDAPAAMTAHIVYDAWDPDRPATSSPKVIGDVIRGEIGFDGLLMSDDLDMKALAFAIQGGLAERAKAALGAGCDVVLQCSGKLADMAQTAKGCRALTGRALERAHAAEAVARRAPAPFDAEEGWARFRKLISGYVA